ncbi:NAD-dependent epimerase/dehydratase family protein [Nocardiopsis dassonvillei]|uniref:NAD-dependent epimerase/dehydratase family protein n=1 Tax=Nocardiopsis dassonvillei TaxID=2014 RepID=UPI00363D5505
MAEPGHLEGRPPTTVVLGASGFVGSVVSGLLARRPGRLRLVARRACAAPEGAVATVETLTGDLTDPATVARAVTGADVVLHLVKHTGDWRLPEERPDTTEPVNVGVMRSVLWELSARPSRKELPPPLVVFAGACTQVGRPPEQPMDGTEPDHPETEYDHQKQAAESLLLEATRAGSVRGISLRLATVFGQSPLSAVPDVGVVVTMIHKALAGEPLTMWHDGTVARDITFVEDVGRAFVAAIDHPDRLVGRHWMIGSGRHDLLGEVFRTVASVVAAATGRPPVPVVSVSPPSTAVVTDFLDVSIDTAPFAEATGWSARIPLREGVERTAEAVLSAAQRSGRLRP